MFVVIFKKKKQGDAVPRRQEAYSEQTRPLMGNESRMNSLFKKTKDSKKQKPKKQYKSSKSQKYVNENVQPQVYVNQSAVQQQKYAVDQTTQSDISLPPTIEHAVHTTHASINNNYPDSEYKLLYETTDSGIPVYPKEEYDIPIYQTSHEKSYIHQATVIDPLTEAKIFPKLTSASKSLSCDFIEYEREPKNYSNKIQSFNIVQYESSPKYRAEIKHLPPNIVEYESSPNAKKKFRNSPLPKKQSKVFQMASQMKKDRDAFLTGKTPDNSTSEYQYSSSEVKTSTPQQTYSTSSRTEFKSSSPEPKLTSPSSKYSTPSSQNYTAPSPNYSSGYNSAATNYSTSRDNTSSPGNNHSTAAKNYQTPVSNRSTPDYKYSSYETKKTTPELKTRSSVSPKPLLESEIVFNSTEMYSQEMTYSRKTSESSANSKKESECYETKKCSMSKSEKSTSTPNLRKTGDGLSSPSDLLAKYGIGNGQRAEQAK